MKPLDWIVIIVYILVVIGIGFYLSFKQKNQADYYVAGRRMRPVSVALSMVATQVSAVSLIGVPAFISIKEGGGLIWWQYEFAVPLAMILIMLFLVPAFYKINAITIYEFLERRYGKIVRVAISCMFMLSRGLSTGVILYATSIAASSILNIPLYETILIVGIVTIIYTTLGGIAADIYSDIIQLVVLWGSALIMVIIMLIDVNFDVFGGVNPQRLRVFDITSTGLGDGRTFGFLPMLIGGLFLYLSYYGTDQSEAQRILTTASSKDSQKALMLNGLLRFPLVFTYSLVGLLLISYIGKNPWFAEQLEGKPADFIVPTFVYNNFPTGLVGLFMGGILAATMSSVDSALNALSAATYRDFLSSMFKGFKTLDNKKQLFIAKVLTVFWGVFALIFALNLGSGRETVVEVINKIGSAFYGPVFGVFFLGIITKKADTVGALIGLISGFSFNLFLWLFVGERVSWMWWNFFGFAITFIIGYILSFKGGKSLMNIKDIVEEFRTNRRRIYALIGMFFVIIFISLMFHSMAGII